MSVFLPMVEPTRRIPLRSSVGVVDDLLEQEPAGALPGPSGG